MNLDFIRRTWAEIDLDAIAHNYREIRRELESATKLENAARTETATKMCCVVKADAYGHGAVTVAREYESLGADWLAVSNLEEAEELRGAGIRLPILILGYTPPELALRLCHGSFSQTILSLNYAARLSDVAQRGGYTVKGHIAVDTGMSRIGFLYQDPERDKGSVDEMVRACQMPGIIPEGIFTHFSVADGGEEGRYCTNRQFRIFTHAISLLKQRGITFRLHHCANSAAVLDYPEFHLDMVRPGIILYGLQPSGEVENRLDLRPAMRLKSTVSLVKQVEKGTTVSYGRCFTADRAMLIGTVPVGYADGYPRALFGKGWVLICGKRAPIVGRICMDQLMVDLSDIPEAKVGDEVVLFGSEPTADEAASLVGTIGYELVCGVSRRVSRVYLRQGKAISVENRMHHASIPV